MNHNENIAKNNGKNEDGKKSSVVTPIIPTNSNTNNGAGFGKYATVAVIALLIGIGLGWSFNNKESSSESQKSDTLSTSGSKMMENNTNGEVAVWPKDVTDALTVSNQSAGLEVKIDKISVPKSVWVAIHEDNGSGEPGNILGAQLFDVGMTSGKVELLRGTEENQTYYVMIHDDNGDRAFIPKMDVPIVDALGKPIMVTFKTLANSSDGSSNSTSTTQTQ